MTDRQTDIVIVGGGLVGLTLACSLAKASPHLDITILEAGDPQKMLEASFDGRVCAIAYKSKQIFEKAGAWKSMARHAGDILDIRITDGHSPLFIHYDHKMVGDEPMGHIVENRHLRKALMQGIKKHKQVHLLGSTRYTAIEYGAQYVEVSLDNGDHLKAKLIVAADGKFSSVRRGADISCINANYRQSGIVCTIKHEQPHDNIAQERFLPAGPFAILPMKNSHHSSLVWTEKTSLTSTFMGMNDEDFLAQVKLRFTDYLGKLSLVGPRFSYPLSLKLAHSYIGKRLCLIGDAAHAIHPIAGQGFNLGIRDVETLTNAITHHAQLGLDIGNASLLQQYQELRRGDNMAMVTVTDGLTRLFSNNVPLLRTARRAGMGAVNQLPMLKKYFMRHAMGMEQHKHTGT